MEIPGQTVEVPDIPWKTRVALPAQNSAVIVVDMQNDFVKEGGSLVVPAAAATLENVQTLLASARSAGVHIAYTQDSHVEGDPEWDIWPRHCEVNSWGWEIVAELAPQKEDLVCQKSRYDGFYGTPLEHFLTNVWQVRNLVIVGTVSSICVLHTAASAGLRWFTVVLPSDCISALTEFDQALTLRQVSWLYTGSVTRNAADISFVEGNVEQT
ncbi:MAG: cysteine hydrolase [Caldilineaceae bacterium]|nr:cysteine hydrolase [Caldilineaceae bacterium]MDE0068154.1 cysteine hydrolase [Caldilineaceae bacterium]MDE0180978.1 cysteine hydrolase [Caldilineaceae bacterium]